MGSSTVGPVASTADEETNPDTNGSVVVYGADRGTSQAGADIYWNPIGGGAESQLALDGSQQSSRLPWLGWGLAHLHPSGKTPDQRVG